MAAKCIVSNTLLPASMNLQFRRHHCKATFPTFLVPAHGSYRSLEVVPHTHYLLRDKSNSPDGDQMPLECWKVLPA